MRKVQRASALLLALLSGCSFIPVYNRPALPVVSQYPIASGGSGPAAADIGWRQFFADPALQQLIALSIANNRNLRAEVLNVQEAEAQYRVDRASLFPDVEGNAYQEVEHLPANLSESGREITSHEYGLGAQAVSWEIDLFGKLRAQAESARETFLSDQDTAVSAQLALVAQLASEYYTWQSDRESLQIAQQTADADQKSLQLTQLELTHGVENALDVAQAQSTYYAAVSDTAQFQRQVAQDMDELVLLAGTPLPPALVQAMESVDGLANEPALPDVPAGLPSDLLTRRPDIRSAEHELLAANANVGAARSAFFPTISLTASGGHASNALNSLFAGGQSTWLFEPQITLPIFTGGANIANLDIAKVEKNIQIADYEGAIQSAFHDVSDALTARTTYVDQVQAEQNLVAANTQFYNLALMRFKGGVDTYLEVLVAQDSLLNSRLTLVSLQLAQQQNEITLYKSLGGGWAENDVGTAVPGGQGPAEPAVVEHNSAWSRF